VLIAVKCKVNKIWHSLSVPSLHIPLNVSFYVILTHYVPRCKKSLWYLLYLFCATTKTLMPPYLQSVIHILLLTYYWCVAYRQISRFTNDFRVFRITILLNVIRLRIFIESRHCGIKWNETEIQDAQRNDVGTNCTSRVNEQELRLTFQGACYWWSEYYKGECNHRCWIISKNTNTWYRPVSIKEIHLFCVHHPSLLLVLYSFLALLTR
jgi:hypothetical protein